MSMRQLFTLIYFLLIIPIWSDAQQSDLPRVIFIYGTSCAGKSSLSKQLVQRLGNQWQLIDRDEVIEERQNSYLQLNPNSSKQQMRQAFDEIESHADEYVLEKIRYSFQNQLHVIIDTQSHHNLRKQLEDCHSLSVLVYAPLTLLLERDAQRNQHLKRSEQRQFYAKAFIFETFAQLYTLKNPQNEGKKVAFIDLIDWDKSLFDYCLHPQTYAFFASFCQASQGDILWSKEDFDLLINSQQQSLNEAVEMVMKCHIYLANLQSRNMLSFMKN